MLLVLVDAIRGGRAREREVAKQELSKLLSKHSSEHRAVNKQNRNKLIIGGEIEVSRSELHKLVKQYHIHRLYLFGSASRSELRPDTDIDLLIEFAVKHTPSMGGMVEIKNSFEALFHGRKVDIATPSILSNPYRKRAIEKDIELLYAA